MHSPDKKTDVKVWSDRVAALAVDALIDSGFVRREDFQAAAATVPAEILVRLSLSDYPLREEFPPPADTAG